MQLPYLQGVVHLRLRIPHLRIAAQAKIKYCSFFLWGRQIPEQFEFGGVGLVLLTVVALMIAHSSPPHSQLAIGLTNPAKRCLHVCFVYLYVSYSRNPHCFPQSLSLTSLSFTHTYTATATHINAHITHFPLYTRTSQELTHPDVKLT